MSRTGCCYDNAVMERFFWSLKYEWTGHENFPNLEEARLSVFRYIETIYNPQRLHQTLGYLSPTSSKPFTPRPPRRNYRPPVSESPELSQYR
jgi:putative transposase